MIIPSTLYETWYWWMTTDPNVWQAGSFYDWWWIETRKDSRKLYLSPSYNNEQVLNNRNWWYIIWSIFDSIANNVIVSYDWYIGNNLNTESTYWNKFYKWNWYFYNVFRITTTADYWVLIWNDWIYRWLINTWDTYLWIQGANVVTNPTFWATASWSIWTGWAISWNKATHTPWNTNTLSQVLTLVNNTYYTLSISSTVTAWTCTVSLWWVTVWTLSTATNWIIQTFAKISASTGEELDFTPSSNFDWYISTAYVYQSNIKLVTSLLFNPDAPYLQEWTDILIWNWNVITAIDVTTTTWTSSTAVTIDTWFTIKWFTKIWDQIFIYATDWSVTKQYLWDWVSLAVQRSITWYDKPLNRVISWNNIDYLVVSTKYRKSLWQVNWYQPDLIAQSNFINDNIWDKFVFNTSLNNSIETIWTKFLIWWYWSIYTYWNYSPWFPKWLLREYMFASWPSTSWYITNINYSESNNFNLFYHYTKINSSWIIENYWCSQYLNDNKYNNNTPIYKRIWYVIQSPFYWTFFLKSSSRPLPYWQDKQQVKMRVWYKLRNNKQLINIYARIDENTSYCNFFCKWITNLPAVGDTYTNWWNTYTITYVTNIGYLPSDKPAIIWATFTWSAYPLTSWYLTKSTWSGDSIIETYTNLLWFELVTTLTDIYIKTQTFTYDKQFNKINYCAVLYTEDYYTSPELYDITPIETSINNDIT